MEKKFKIFLQENSRTRNILFFVIAFLAIISVARAMQQAQIYSYDFSVSTAKLVSEGINNYEYVLEGKHDKSENDKPNQTIIYKSFCHRAVFSKRS